MMGGGSPAQSTGETRYNTLQLQDSSYGSPLPLVYGKSRVAGTLIWYGSFQSIPHSQGGGGKGGGGGGGSTTYTYQAALAIALCEGPITGVGAIWADKAQQTLSSLGLTLFTGAGGQAAWSYLTTNFPSQADGYDHTAYVAHSSYPLGSSAGMPNLSYELQGFFTDAAFNGDAELYNILVDYCTDANHGCGFNYLAPLTGTNSYQQYCKSLGLSASPVEERQRAAKDFIEDILKISNSEAVWTAGGLLKIIPRADSAVSGSGASFTPNNGAGGPISTPIYTLTDNAFVADPEEDPITLVPTASPDLYNVMRVQFLDRANQYNPAPAEAKDDADIALNGERVAEQLKLDAITQLSVATQVANFEKNRALYYADQYEFRCLPDYQLLEPMDVIAITDPRMGISNLLCRVVKISEGDDTDDTISMTVEALPIGPGTAPQYSAETGLGYTPDYSTAPGSVQTPKIFAAPPQLVHSVAGYEVWIAVSGPSGSTTWGGCNVLMSLDGGTTYAQIGVIPGPARYGTLSSTFASGSDPDTTNALQVTLNNTALALTGGSASDADNMRLLALVENEIVSFQYCTLTGAGAYTFTSTGLVGGTKYMRRGKYGSTIASHASGTSFVRLDGNIFKLPIDAGIIGQTIHFKFQSFNIFGDGLEAVAGLTDYTYTVPTIVGGVDPSSNTLMPTGSVPPSVPAGAFSYTSTTSSVTLVVGASFTATISGALMTVSAVASGSISVGMVVAGTGVTAGTRILQLGTGSGGTGNYILDTSSTVGSGTSMTGSPVVYRADGTTIALSAGSQAVTGLASGTTYKVYPYMVDNFGTSGSVSWVAVTGGSGSPAICYPPAGNALAASTMYARGNIPLNGFSVSTTSAGTGGGGGGGGGCLHPLSTVMLADGRAIPADMLMVGDCLPAPEGSGRIVSITRRPCSRWISVKFNGRTDGSDLIVTDDHWFYNADGCRVRASELHLGDILKAEGDHLRVTALGLWDEFDELVSIELEAPHLYYLGRRGPLCHNPKP